MVQQTVLGDSLVLLQQLGIYDVVLPFLLVFTIMFAIFEKTKILGTEKKGDDKVTKKNLNATASFVIAMLVIASSKLVEAITAISSQIVILLLLGVFFLLLIGVVYKEGSLNEDGLKESWARNAFIGVMLLGLAIIFFNNIRTQSGKSWLQEFTSFISRGWGDQGVATILLVIGIIVFIYVLTSGSGGGGKKEKKD